MLSKYLHAIWGVILFLVVYSYNIIIPGFPLDLRALGTILLFMFSILFYNKSISLLFSKRESLFAISFLLLSVLFSLLYHVDFLLIKYLFQCVIFLILGYVFAYRSKFERTSKIVFCISALMSLYDLVYNISHGSSLNPIRLLDAFQKIDAKALNHNFFGFVCGLAFIFVFSRFKDKIKKKEILLLILFIVGIVLSTSRSAFLGVFLCLLILFRFKYRMSLVKVFLLFGIASSFIISILFTIVTILPSVSGIDEGIADNVKRRLIEEPANILKDEKEETDNIQWRQNLTQNNLSKFYKSPFGYQFLGLGIGNYLKVDYGGNKLNPHNGYVLLLIERGIICFVLFSLVLIQILYKAFSKRRKYYTYCLILVFTLIYCYGQNEELTGVFVFYLIGASIKEIDITNQYKSLDKFNIK